MRIQPQGLRSASLLRAPSGRGVTAEWDAATAKMREGEKPDIGFLCLELGISTLTRQ